MVGNYATDLLITQPCSLIVVNYLKYLVLRIILCFFYSFFLFFLFLLVFSSFYFICGKKKRDDWDISDKFVDLDWSVSW